MRILMLGNSFTSANNLPQLIAKRTGAEVVAHTRGGARLKEHLNPNTKMGAKTLAALKEEPWDFVILQEMSNGPITAKESFRVSAGDLCDLIWSIGAKPVFYATWAYQKECGKLVKLGLSYDEMYEQMHESYYEAAKENNALIADVGTAFYENSSDIPIYADDGCHPSAVGSEIAADVISEIIRNNYRQLAANDGDEFCPRCDANLTLQKGYRNDLPYWVCKGCGEMLINPRVEADDDVAWICDQCESLLNEQDGFKENCDSWKCTECGFVNQIDESMIYLSEDEYQISLSNPYKGMTDEDVIELMSYEEIRNLDERENVVLVKMDGKNYVKKILSTYNESVYRYLMCHPIAHMPQIFKVYRGDRYLVIIEEYIEGSSLSEHLREGTFEPFEAARIARDLCCILNELHTLGCPIIHRDIKPSNVMLTKSGEVVLLDMNVAKWYDSEEKEDTRLLGTKDYAAPEQAGYGMKASSDKTDIYAVGILLNVMLTGKLPKEKPAQGKLWDIIERCISLDADTRYSADELIERLDNYLGENTNAGKKDR